MAVHLNEKRLHRMFSKLRSWGVVEIERLKAGNLKETKPSHIWIARVWSNDILGSNDYLLSVPFNTKKELLEFKRSIKRSPAKYKVTEHKIEFDGDYTIQ